MVFISSKFLLFSHNGDQSHAEALGLIQIWCYELRTKSYADLRFSGRCNLLYFIGPFMARSFFALVFYHPRSKPTVIESSFNSICSLCRLSHIEKFFIHQYKYCTRGRTRTGTTISGRGILSPLRLPISPPGQFVGLAPTREHL